MGKESITYYYYVYPCLRKTCVYLLILVCQHHPFGENALINFAVTLFV